MAKMAKALHRRIRRQVAGGLRRRKKDIRRYDPQLNYGIKRSRKNWCKNELTPDNCFEEFGKCRNF